MNEIIRCLKLVEYGTQAKVTKIFSIIFFVIGIAYFFFTLNMSGWLNGFSGFIIGFGGMFLWQPAITCNYLKLTDSAPMRKMMTVRFFPLMSFVTFAVQIVFFAAAGGIASAFLPMAGRNAVNAMILSVLTAALVCIAICMPKLKPVFIFFDWLVCTAAVEHILIDDTYDFAELTGIGYDRIFSWAVVCIVGTGLVSLLTLGVLRLLYKKPYSSFYRKMAENYKGNF
ncbi:MAG: hypothetical protein K2N72_03565 [Oscillospiraceae bacterium]|nr:hypothetical protein [Oscillospiraceae bacterium]